MTDSPLDGPQAEPVGQGPSPIDEMRVAADLVWQKVAGPDYVLTEQDIDTMVETERAMRESWMKKSSKKAIEREEKRAEAKENG